MEVMRAFVLVSLFVCLVSLHVSAGRHAPPLSEEERLVHGAASAPIPRLFSPRPQPSDQQLRQALKQDWTKSLTDGVDRRLHRSDDIPAQVKLSFIPGGMAVSWSTQQPVSAPTVHYGIDTEMNLVASAACGPTYGTLYFHTVLLQELAPNIRYFYQIAGRSDVFSFVSAHAPGDSTPFSLFVVGDMGLANSQNTMSQLRAHLNQSDWILHIGDLSYADDFYLRPGNTYEGSWDAWQDEMEDITSQVAYMTEPGNHEVVCTEITPFLCPPQQRNFTAYRNRVRMPWRESGGEQNLWYSFDYGLVHFVQFNTESDFPSSPMGPGTWFNAGPFGDQLAWIEADLAAAAANRQKVPWIVASGHRPWYTSHAPCASCQAAFEALFLKYGVDIVFHGHVHWYERLWPIAAGGVVTQQNYTQPEGIVYIINGAAGNIEGHNPPSNPLPYSALIDDSDYGYGRLQVYNESVAQWQFFRSTDNSLADDIVITKSR